jgi:hypothetical protein
MKNNLYGYIYKTTNLKNKKIYIGKKKGEFNSDYFGSGIILKQAINKYDKKNFKLEVVVYAKDIYKLNKLEKQYIKEYRKILGNKSLYNIADGGDGGRIRFGPHTKETIERIKKTKAEHPYKHSDECREKIRKIMLGSKRNKYKRHKNVVEVRKNISIATKEAMWKPEVREKYLIGIKKREEKKNVKK